MQRQSAAVTGSCAAIHTSKKNFLVSLCCWRKCTDATLVILGEPCSMGSNFYKFPFWKFARATLPPPTRTGSMYGYQSSSSHPRPCMLSAPAAYIAPSAPFSHPLYSPTPVPFDDTMLALAIRLGQQTRHSKRFYSYIWSCFLLPNF